MTTATTRGPARHDDGADTVLRIQGLTARFGGVTALNDLNATVLRGEVIGVVGPNGAGKTTLLNAVSGLLGRAVSGQIDLFGHPVLHHSAVSIAASGVARSFQHPPLLEKVSVLENILIGSQLTGGSPALTQVFLPRRAKRHETQERERARALLDQIGISDWEGLEAGSLPYGARKQVDILRAIFQKPAILLLDEPTSGLDIGEQQRVVEIIEDIKSDPDISVLLVEHHMDIVRRCASRVLGVQAGRVIATGTPTEVFESATYREAVVGHAHQAPSADATSESSDAE